MRGAEACCAFNQALTAEAASVVKQGLVLARQRGHAQVTPLHMACTMLTYTSGLLRLACRKNQSHSLQCKALDLCFSVALNRLPTSGPLLLGHHHPPPLHPSISNSLAAAFKRAQAQQRRGAAEHHQPAVILAPKIELRQLVVSVLDDPSVSRIMKEAGFSSTQVRASVEQAVALEFLCGKSKENNTHPLDAADTAEDVPPSRGRLQIEEKNPMMTRKNVVVVDECLARAGHFISSLKHELGHGNAPETLKCVQFISLPSFDPNTLSRDDVEKILNDLKSQIGKGHSGNEFIILYMGDLKWVSELWSDDAERICRMHSPVELMVMELRNLAFGNSDGVKVLIIGVATFETYERCRMRRPSLETIWDLHPFIVPDGRLDLSLRLNSNLDAVNSSCQYMMSKADPEKPEIESTLTSSDCCINGTSTARCTVANHGYSTSISSCKRNYHWLQEEESRHSQASEPAGSETELAILEQGNFRAGHVDKKRRTFCSSDVELTLASPVSFSSENHCQKTMAGDHGRPSIVRCNQIYEDGQSGVYKSSIYETHGVLSSSRCYTDQASGKKPDLLSNPSSGPNSASSSEVLGVDHHNTKGMCEKLEARVPWQKDIIPKIVTWVLQSRSGDEKTERAAKHVEKYETWMFFFGVDHDGKEKVAIDLSRLIFGSKNCYIPISLGRLKSAKENGKKKARDEMGQSYIDVFTAEVNDNPHRVFYLEDIERAERNTQMGIKRAMDSGAVELPGGEYVPLQDAVIIISCDTDRLCSSSGTEPGCTRDGEEMRGCEGRNGAECEDEEKRSPRTTLDLNLALQGENGEDEPGEDLGILASVRTRFFFKTKNV